MDFDSKDFVAKILIVGDSEVGKTSILNRFTDNTFQTDTVSTVGTFNGSINT